MTENYSKIFEYCDFKDILDSKYRSGYRITYEDMETLKKLYLDAQKEIVELRNEIARLKKIDAMVRKRKLK